MLSVVLTIVVVGVVVHVDGACMTSSDCKTCVSESPGNFLLEGFRCQMCQSGSGTARVCVGDFADNIGGVKCTIKAKNAAECDERFASATTTVPTTTTTTATTTTTTTTATMTTMATTTTAPFFTGTAAPPADNTVAIAVGVVVAIVVIALFVLVVVCIVLKQRLAQQQQQQHSHMYALPGESARPEPSFSLPSGRVLEGTATGYSNRDSSTIGDGSGLSSSQRPYIAMPYSETQAVPSSPGSVRQQYYDLDVIKPPPKTVDLNGNDVADSKRSGTAYLAATDLPDIDAYKGVAERTAGYAGARAPAETIEEDQIAMLTELAAPISERVSNTGTGHVQAHLETIDMELNTGDLNALEHQE